MENVLAVVLAGGKGSRLEPLTRDRAKPAVPFGGAYRIIDFTLSNCLNSGLRKMLVLTQYKAMSLDRHINMAWKRYLCWELGEFLEVLPPQQRIDEHWYQGTADAVYQNIYTLEKERPEYVVILAGDHIYKMDYFKLVEAHKADQADLTVAALRVTLDEAREFGVMQVDTDARILGSTKSRLLPRVFRAMISMLWHRWASTSSRPVFCSSNCASTPRAPAASTILAATSSLRSSKRTASSPSRFGDENRKSDAVLARRRHARRLLRGQHGSGRGRPAVEHVRRTLAHPHLFADLSAAEIRVCRKWPRFASRPGPG